MNREWLSAAKFGNIFISRFTARSWPARSPCLSPLDYWFWSVCLSELRRSPPHSPDELMDTVNQFAYSLEGEEIKKACNECKGGAFAYKLKKIRREDAVQLELVPNECS